MLSLYLVRHGQTDFSRQNCFCGAIDPPLNAIGLAMADAVAARYGQRPWAAIYSSPMLRARQTAAPTAGRAGLSVVEDGGLREIAYGRWEGRPETEVERDEPDAFHAWAANPGLVSPPGGETGFMIAARALPFIARIRAAHEGGNVLAVSHKATCRVLVCALLGIDVNLFRARVSQPVASVTVIDFKKSGPLVRVLGDTSHLPPDLSNSDGT